MLEEIVEPDVLGLGVLAKCLDDLDADFVMLVFWNFPTECELVLEAVDEHPDNAHKIALDMEIVQLIGLSEAITHVCILIEIGAIFETLLDQGENEVLEMFYLTMDV